MANIIDILHEQNTLILNELADVKKQLAKLAEKQDQDKFLSIDETRKMWVPAVSRQTIHSWYQSGYLTRHVINGKPYFLLSEIKAAVKQICRYKTKGGSNG